jgi:hypothetical protein
MSCLLLTDKAIHRGIFHSVPDLITAIEAYLTTHNDRVTLDTVTN